MKKILTNIINGITGVLLVPYSLYWMNDYKQFDFGLKIVGFVIGVVFGWGLQKSWNLIQNSFLAHPKTNDAMEEKAAFFTAVIVSAGVSFIHPTPWYYATALILFLLNVFYFRKHQS